MTDTIFVVAVTAALTAAAASIARRHFIAIIAVLFGGAAAVGLARYNGFQQLPKLSTSGEIKRMELHGRPVSWSSLYINGAAVSRPGNDSNISTLSITGANAGSEEIKFHELYFLCDPDGKKLAVQIGRGGTRYKIKDLPSLSPGAFFFVVSDPLGPTDVGLSKSEFLKTCATISFVAKFNDTAQTIEFDRQTVEAALPKP